MRLARIHIHSPATLEIRGFHIKQLHGELLHVQQTCSKQLHISHSSENTK